MLGNRLFSSLRRTLFEPLFVFRNGSPLLRYSNELEQTQFLSESELVNIQWQRLIETLEFVWDNNPFHRSRFESAGITPSTVKSPADMRLIPILTKKEIRNKAHHIISRNYDISKLLNFKTGGSTGKSLDLYITEECSYSRVACARRHDLWTHWKVGEPIAAVWGNPVLPVSVKEKLRQWLIAPYIYLDTMSVSVESVLRFTNEWKKIKPTLLFGHAHSLYVLAMHVRDMNIKIIKPRGILSTSMMLMSHERKVIEAVFGVTVTDRYGCEELGLIASECEMHEGLHLNIDHLFIEFIKDDGSYASPGEPGRIIVTDLINRAMPFIRYQVDDVGTLSNKKCSCGRGLPLMENVTGRVADFLIKKDGSRVAGISLIENTLTKISGIEQMQIVQDSLELITVNLVVDSSYNEASGKYLLSYFNELFQNYADIQLCYKKLIATENNGKYRFSICNIASN